MRRALLGLLPSVVLAACGGDRGPDGGAGGAGTPGAGGAAGDSTAAALCDALRSRAMRCGASLDRDCAHGYGCLARILAPTLVDPVFSCLGGRACDATDDSCFAQVGMTAAPSSVRDAYVRACMDRLGTCPGGFPDDLCTAGDIPWMVLSDPVLAAMTGCFAGGCAEVSRCVEDAAERAAGPDCRATGDDPACGRSCAGDAGGSGDPQTTCSCQTDASCPGGTRQVTCTSSPSGGPPWTCTCYVDGTASPDEGIAQGTSCPASELLDACMAQ